VSVCLCRNYLSAAGFVRECASVSVCVCRCLCVCVYSGEHSSDIIMSDSSVCIRCRCLTYASVFCACVGLCASVSVRLCASVLLLLCVRKAMLYSRPRQAFCRACPVDASPRVRPAL